ncbi:hypothetical protein ACVWYN_003481 [Pedobacter sp. UYP24]
MGKFDGKNFMGFSGKVGGIVAYYLKGQNVIRQVGYPVKPPSKLQIAQRHKLTVINAFLSPLKGFFNTGLNLMVKDTPKNAYNQAVAYASLALEGQYPDISINYTKVILSQGYLKNPENLQLSFQHNTVEITWTKINNDVNRNLDRSMLAFYFPDLGRAFIALTGPERADGRVTQTLPPDFLNQRMIVYIAFQSDDKKEISQSVYLGDLFTTAGL